MKRGVSQRLKYVGVALGNAILKHNEKRAHREYMILKGQIAEFRDMGCFGNSENGPWECGSFRADYVCCGEKCPMYRLNEAYISAYHVWNRTKMALYQKNSLLNAMREDMGIKKAR